MEKKEVRFKGFCISKIMTKIEYYRYVKYYTIIHKQGWLHRMLAVRLLSLLQRTGSVAQW